MNDELTYFQVADDSDSSDGDEKAASPLESSSEEEVAGHQSKSKVWFRPGISLNAAQILKNP